MDIGCGVAFHILFWVGGLVPTATFRFYEELNDFLPRPRRRVDFQAAFKEKRSIKDIMYGFCYPKKWY